MPAPAVGAVDVGVGVSALSVTAFVLRVPVGLRGQLFRGSEALGRRGRPLPSTEVAAYATAAVLAVVVVVPLVALGPWRRYFHRCVASRLPRAGAVLRCRGSVSRVFVSQAVSR